MFGWRRRKLKSKLILFDYDGTLKAQNEARISAETATVLKSFKKAGKIIVLATGRPHAHCEYLLEENLVDCIISANGGLVCTQKAMIAETLLEPQQVESINSYCQVHQIPLTFFSKQMYWNGIQNVHLCNGLKESMNLSPEELSAFDSSLQQQSIHLICAYLSKREETQMKENFPELVIYRWHKDIVSCLSQMVTKMDGIKQTLEYYGVKSEEVIAVGDGGNDVEMLQVAGVGVAMKNGSEFLKSQADWIVDKIDSAFVEKLDQLSNKNNFEVHPYDER